MFLLMRLNFYEYHDMKIVSQIPARLAGGNTDGHACQDPAGRRANRDALGRWQNSKCLNINYIT